MSSEDGLENVIGGAKDFLQRIDQVAPIDFSKLSVGARIEINFKNGDRIEIEKMTGFGDFQLSGPDRYHPGAHVISGSVAAPGSSMLLIDKIAPDMFLEFGLGTDIMYEEIANARVLPNLESQN